MRQMALRQWLDAGKGVLINQEIMWVVNRDGETVTIACMSIGFGSSMRPDGSPLASR